MAASSDLITAALPGPQFDFVMVVRDRIDSSQAEAYKAAAMYAPAPREVSYVSLDDALSSTGGDLSSSKVPVKGILDDVSKVSRDSWRSLRLAEGADFRSSLEGGPFGLPESDWRQVSRERAGDALKFVESRFGLGNIISRFGQSGYDFNPVIESIASREHDLWARTRLSDGWSYAPVLDKSSRKDPSLLPFDRLPERERRRYLDFGYTVMNCLRQAVLRSRLDDIPFDRTVLKKECFGSIVNSLVKGKDGVTAEMATRAFVLSYPEEVSSLREKGMDFRFSFSPDGSLEFVVTRRTDDLGHSLSGSYRLSDKGTLVTPSFDGDFFLESDLRKEGVDVLMGRLHVSLSDRKAVARIRESLDQYRQCDSLSLQRQELLESLYPSSFKEGLFSDRAISSLAGYNKAYLERQDLVGSLHLSAEPDVSLARFRRAAFLERECERYERERMASDLKSVISSSFRQVNSEKGVILQFADTMVEAGAKMNMSSDEFWRSSENCRTLIQLSGSAGADPTEIAETVSSLSGGSFDERDTASVLAGLDRGLIDGYKGSLESGNTSRYFDTLNREYDRLALEATSDILSEGTVIRVYPDDIRKGKPLPRGYEGGFTSDGRVYVSGAYNQIVPDSGLYFVRERDGRFNHYSESLFKALFDMGPDGKAVSKTRSVRPRLPRTRKNQVKY